MVGNDPHCDVRLQIFAVFNPGQLSQMADQWLARVKAWDREPEGIRFGVAMQPGYRLGI